MFRTSVDRLPSNWNNEVADLVIGAVGYEARARHILTTYSISGRVKAAAAFPAQQVFEYERNWKEFEKRDYKVEVIQDEQYIEWLHSLIRTARHSPDCDKSGHLRVVVDISSLTRTRIAHLVSTFAQSGIEGEISVAFLYSLAHYTPPPVEQVSNTHVGPVSKDFAGWWDEPERALSAVVGVGYEQDKALGATEYLQAEDIWLFQPESVEVEYTGALNTANKTLLEAVPKSQLLSYSVHDPIDLFSRLRALVQGLSVTNNVILLPFGPKLFVLCSLLVGVSNNQLAVWRVSAQTNEDPVNRTASGPCYGLRVGFGSSQTGNSKGIE